MTIVAVAGGTGDLGRLIVSELVLTGKHRVYSISRKEIADPDGKLYNPIMVANYAHEQAMTKMLNDNTVHTIICALSIGTQETSDAQERLIRAAAASRCVQRFAPSEYNVNYDLPDSILPYPEKRFHVTARRTIEKTSLEYTYFICGMFMDYYGMPNIESVLTPTYSILDLQYKRAIIPGDGQAILTTTMAKDLARYIAAAVDLLKWPKVFSIAGSQLSVSRLVELAVETKRPEKVQVEHYPIEAYLSHSVPLLPSNNAIVENFPGGIRALRALLCDLDAAVAFGAYDISRIEGSVDLVEVLGDTIKKLITIEQLLYEAWGARNIDN